MRHDAGVEVFAKIEGRRGGHPPVLEGEVTPG
jgi:hypothetical protein